MKINGTHRGREVKVEYESAVANALLERTKRILAKALSKNLWGMTAKYESIAIAWKDIIASPHKINDPAYTRERQSYINKVLFSEEGFARQFQQED